MCSCHIGPKFGPKCSLTWMVDLPALFLLIRSKLLLTISIQCRHLVPRQAVVCLFLCRKPGQVFFIALPQPHLNHNYLTLSVNIILHLGGWAGKWNRTMTLKTWVQVLCPKLGQHVLSQPSLFQYLIKKDIFLTLTKCFESPSRTNHALAAMSGKIREIHEPLCFLKDVLIMQIGWIWLKFLGDGILSTS